MRYRLVKVEKARFCLLQQPLKLQENSRTVKPVAPDTSPVNLSTIITQKRPQ